jgi:copper oxidase (laccase) domain-containing protein
VLRHALEVEQIPRAQLRAVIGPCIQQCCYEVGEEVCDACAVNEDPQLCRPSGNRYFLDLVGLNERQLRDAGLAAHQIASVGRCTRDEAEVFYSYRRQGAKAGRQISWIMIR